METTSTPRPSAIVPIALLAWLVLALAAGFSGVLGTLRPPQPQLLLLSLALLSTLAMFVVPAVRTWVASVDLRWVAAFHFTRFVGFYFLYLCGRGELARDFAVPAGYGDIAVAAFAVVLVATGAPDAGMRNAIWRIWNLAGFADILIVVQLAWRIGTQDPASIAALLRMPLVMLLTFVVPLIIASHVLVVRRLTAIRDAAEPKAT